MAPADVRSVNRWSAFTEAQIATGLVSMGVPRDEAARQAAATVVGAAGGAAVGAAALGVPAATLGAAGGAAVGAVGGGIAGALVAAPLTPLLLPVLGPAAPAVAGPLAVGGGMIIGGLGGAAAGAAALGIPAALLGAGLGGAVGGLAGWALGAGDPGATPGAPDAPGAQDNPWAPRPLNPGANQYELTWKNSDQSLPGGPEATYTVKSNGDVRATASLGGHEVAVGWSGEQADAPYKALGFGAQTARDTVTRAVVTIGEQADRTLDALTIDYPQHTPPAAGGKHRKDRR